MAIAAIAIPVPADKVAPYLHFRAALGDSLPSVN